MKHIALLGSTGSIGRNALDVIETNPAEYCVASLGAGRNIDLLFEQVRKFRPASVAVLDEPLADRLRARLNGSRIPVDVHSGTEGYARIATLDGVDTVISAISGAAGLAPTYAAVRAGKTIALANKETMVMAGPLVMAEARKRGVSVLPVDSEHSAVFQCLQGHPREDLKRIVITASGGPFRQWTLEAMKAATPEQALRHPNWSMGSKITIDSATLMNKGLEVIEAKWLFDLRDDQISVLIHPQSIVHSMAEYRDGSIIAQLGVPHMMTPIAYALSYPHHRPTPLPPLALEEVGSLTFERPDLQRFRCLDLAQAAVRAGGSMPAVLNGANEIAVASFLAHEITFLQIPRVVEETMKAHEPIPITNIEEVLHADAWARERAARCIQEWGGQGGGQP